MAAVTPPAAVTPMALSSADLYPPLYLPPPPPPTLQIPLPLHLTPQRLDWHLWLRPRTYPGHCVLDDRRMSECLDDERTYQAYRPGKYLMPNDSPEQARMNLEHFMALMAMKGKLYYAPLREVPRRVLDVATGTGMWPAEFAAQFPTSQVVATDLSLIQPQPRVDNLHFVRADVEDEVWALDPSHTFDLVHMRTTSMCFDDRAAVFRRCYEHMTPGGYIELQEPFYEVFSEDDTHADSMLTLWCRVLRAGLLVATGGRRDLRSVRRYADMLTEAGFVDVTTHTEVMPWGIWPQRSTNLPPEERKQATMLGRIMACNATQLMWSCQRTLRSSGLSRTSVLVLSRIVMREMLQGHVHAWSPFFIIHARKPLPAGRAEPKPAAMEPKLDGSSGGKPSVGPPRSFPRPGSDVLLS